MTLERADDEPVFRWRLRVYWEDTDGAGIVYYANYLKYLERARTELLRVLGCDQQELARREGVVFVVRAIAAEFLRPARLDDELIVVISRLSAAASRVEMEQYVARDNERLLEASVKLACVNIDSFLPVRLPRSLRELLADRSSGRPKTE
ncbi:MAG: tol-pal system-associated acyl-CoA thioesterase [Betaproteobacteria bacterium]|nr:tol-pal system-associated acyl-CoA thioesterase [Betaproteobacteria bacterium]